MTVLALLVIISALCRRTNKRTKKEMHSKLSAQKEMHRERLETVESEKEELRRNAVLLCAAAHLAQLI